MFSALYNTTYDPLTCDGIVARAETWFTSYRSGSMTDLSNTDWSRDCMAQRSLQV